MLRELESVLAELASTEPLSSMAGSTVAIDANEYLSRFLFPSPVAEPLLTALGGVPLTMRRHVTESLDALEKAEITPVFYFDGLDYGTSHAPFDESDKSMGMHALAWRLYSHQEPDEAVKMFGKSKAFRPKSFFRFLQSILVERGILFKVAPYSVWAQLAYLEQQGNRFVDAVAGAWEMLVFDVSKVIVKLDTTAGTFSWVSRDHVLAHFNITGPAFVDAALLTGSRLVPTYPLIDANPNRTVTRLKVAVDLLAPYGGSANTFLSQHDGAGRLDDDAAAPSMSGSGAHQSYLDLYRRGLMAVKHHCVMSSDGKVGPFAGDQAPNDVHSLVGHRLPDELYFYLSEGLIGPRMLNWRTSGEIVEPAPLDGGDSDEYRALVTNKLSRIRALALCLLSTPLARFYVHKEVSVRPWFDRASLRTVFDRTSADGLPVLTNWLLRQPSFTDLIPAGSTAFLANAARCLKNAVFVQTSLNNHAGTVLEHADEVVYNVLWRFFRTIGYIDADHSPTKWGRMLFAILDAVADEPELHEAAFFATELARNGFLNCLNMFPTYSVPAPRANEQDNLNILLVSRVACLGQLGHESIGFTGPLSRHLLAFGSTVSAIRTSLRDLIEAIAVNMFLTSGAERTRKDYRKIAMSLPFLLDHDCSLGIAVQSYLNALIDSVDPKSDEVKDVLLEKGATQWFPHSTGFRADIKKAFRLWDAVYAGVLSHEGLVRDVEDFKAANEWLKDLR